MSKLRQKQRKDARKKKAQKNAARWAERNKPLWSVSTPHHNLLSKEGKVRLYHYTEIECIGRILEYGLIKGDVVGRDPIGLDNWNAPNLTKENRWHNPMNKPQERLDNDPVHRLEVYFDENDENIIPFGWFDRTYCNRNNTKIIALCNADGKMNGNINDQYIYRGKIDPSQIKKISVWNPETKYWDRLSKSEKEEARQINNDLSMTCMARDFFNWDLLRMTGMSSYDWTGELKTFFALTDGKEVLSPLYEKTDQIVARLNKKSLSAWRQNLYRLCRSNQVNEVICHIGNTYNEMIATDPMYSGSGCDHDWCMNLKNRLETWSAEVIKKRPGERVLG